MATISKLLFDQYPLVINTSLAVKIGLNEAIVLQQIHYWAEINEKAKKNNRDGHYWTFNSYADWQKQFPFWSERTIRRAIAKLEEGKIIVSDNYNRLSIDRTKWYRVEYKIIAMLDSFPCGQNGQINWTDWTSHVDKMGRPLPETNPKIKTKIKDNGISLAGYPAISFSDLTDLTEDESKAMGYYMLRYSQHMGKEHPRLKPEQWERIRLGLFECYFEEHSNSFDVSVEALGAMIDKHFETKYKKCDYNMLHFIEHGIKVRRMYEVAY